jgi:hypothetical protein
MNSQTWKIRYYPNVQLMHALSNNETCAALAFQTAELSIAYDIFTFFSIPPPHLEPEMEKEDGGILYPVWRV